jgi:uncharacterized iron-regulated protein
MGRNTKMSEQQKKELENAMNLQAEAQAAEAHGQQIAQDVAEGTKKIYQSIEKGVVDGYKAIENGVVTGYKAIENGVVGSFNKITDKFVGAFLTKDGETVEQAKERLAAEQKAREQSK